MKRLRHPIRAIREPFGTAGLIIACLALVAALGGSAYAAASKLNSTQKKEVEKIAKKYAGKPGANGPTGPAGSAGAAGKNGNDGAAGTGTPGANGTSVTTTNFSGTKGSCKAGGVEVKSASPTVNVCNGTPGAIQPGETLPEGVTLKGEWSGLTSSLVEVTAESAISFGIPLETKPTIAYVGQGQEGTSHAAECPGTWEEPEAEEGFLCVYTNSQAGLTFQEPGGATTTTVSAHGAHLHFKEGGVAGLTVYGSWAVTAG
jgi:hypothetical protein